MQLFSSIKIITIRNILFTLLVYLFSSSSIQAADVVTHNLHIGWTYTNTSAIPVSGFRLYKEDSILCDVTGETVRSMDCEFQSVPGTFNFYLAVYSSAAENALSAPFAFTLYPPTTDLPNAVIATSTTAGNGPLRVSFDASGSIAGAGEVTDFSWDFDDNTTSAHNIATQHTYSYPGIYHPVLTITNSSGYTDQSTTTIEVYEQDLNNIPPEALFSATQIQLDSETLTLELDAGNSLDEDGYIVSYVWDLGNNRFETGANITHAFPANKVSVITLTVTDDSGTQHTRSINTIRFLKQIHATVIFHINSFLLNKD